MPTSGYSNTPEQKLSNFRAAPDWPSPRSHAIIPASVAATSIKKVGQATQCNTHSSNFILICSHVRVKHLKSHQMKQLIMCRHLNTSVRSFTKLQHTAAIGRTSKTEKGMPEEARRGTPKVPKCLCLIWTACVQLYSTKNSLKLDHIHESYLDGGESWERWQRRDCRSHSQPTGQSNERENLSFYLSISNPFVLRG